MMKQIAALLLAAAALFAKVPEIEVDELVWEDLTHEADGFVQSLKDEELLESDPAVQHYLDSLLGVISIPAGVKASSFRIHIIKTAEPDAFSLADGTICISISLFPLITHEAQAIFLLGHEIAHVAQKHHLQRTHEYHKTSHSAMSQYLAAAIITGFQTNVSSNIARAMQGFSHGSEREADSLALVWLGQTGHKPGHALELFQNVYNWEDRETRNRASSTHPALLERISYGKQMYGLKTLPVSASSETVSILTRTAEISACAAKYAVNNRKFEFARGIGELYSAHQISTPAMTFMQASAILKDTVRTRDKTAETLLKSLFDNPEFGRSSRKELAFYYLRSGRKSEALPLLREAFAENEPDSELIRFYIKRIEG